MSAALRVLLSVNAPMRLVRIARSRVKRNDPFGGSSSNTSAAYAPILPSSNAFRKEYSSTSPARAVFTSTEHPSIASNSFTPKTGNRSSGSGQWRLTTSAPLSASCNSVNWNSLACTGSPSKYRATPRKLAPIAMQSRGKSYLRSQARQPRSSSLGPPCREPSAILQSLYPHAPRQFPEARRSSGRERAP